MKKEPLILKLGGSIVTEKDGSTPKVRTDLVCGIARTIKRLYNPERHALVLIHGAGSFGHLHAHQHKLAEGTKDHPQKLFRAVENQSLDERLNSELVELFVTAGLPVSGFLSRALVTNRRGKLKTFDFRSVDAALKCGAIPLLHGDMVFDMAWGLSVSSGDVQIAYLAAHLKARAVFFASDVDGIFSSDPHRDKTAKLIPSLDLKDLRKGRIALGASHNTDVTGGLSKKFLLFEKKGSHSLRSLYIFNGLKAKNFTYLFDQRNFLGTRIALK